MLPGYKLYTALPGQSHYDICLQVYGVLDYTVKLAIDNAIADMDALPAVGAVYQYNPSLVYSQQIAQLGNIYATYYDGANQIQNRNFNNNFDENFN